MTKKEWEAIELAYEMLVEEAGKPCSCMRYEGVVVYKCIQCDLREILEKYKGGDAVEVE